MGSKTMSRSLTILPNPHQLLAKKSITQIPTSRAPITETMVVSFPEVFSFLEIFRSACMLSFCSTEMIHSFSHLFRRCNMFIRRGLVVGKCRVFIDSYKHESFKTVEPKYYCV